jgi:hypothetical protein
VDAAIQEVRQAVAHVTIPFIAASGIHVQQLVPGPELGPVANHIFADLPYSISAHRCRDGSIIVLQEDDVYGKNIVWRITAKKSNVK